MNKKIIIYITPHLSTGGLPQYLLKKVEKFRHEYDIHVVEYSDHGIFRVQKNKILDMLPFKVYTLGEDRSEILSMIKRLKPDILHFCEIPELFMDDEITKKIYTSSRTYHIVETSHDSRQSHDTKRFYPDWFLFCSDNQISHYNKLKVPSSVLEYYPEVDNSITKEQAMEILDLDPNMKHVLNVGLFTPRKNQREFITYGLMTEAYEKYHNIFPSTLFHCVGNLAGNFEDYWKPLNKDFPENLKIWGEREDTHLFYRAMDLFVFTSKEWYGDKETNPIVLKEAYAHGIPILAHSIDSYLDKFDNARMLSYLTPGHFSIKPTILEFNKNLVKIETKLKSNNDKFIQIKQDQAEANKFFVSFENDDCGWMFRAFENRLLTVSDSMHNLCMYTIFIKHTNFWFSLNTSLSLVQGLVIRIWDIDQETWAKGADYSDHQLLYEKTVSINPEKTYEYDLPQLYSSPGDQSAFFTFYEMFHLKGYTNDIVKVEQDDVVVDIGANLGFFSLYSVFNGAKEVHSFEPAKVTYKNLCKNVADYDNIHCYNVAVSNHDDEIELASFPISSIPTVCNLTQNPPSGWDHEVHFGHTEMFIDNVNSMSIKHIIDFIPKIDFLKIDCEGAEWDIMSSIPVNYLKNNVKKIALELHYDPQSKTINKHSITNEKDNDFVNKLKDAEFEINYDIMDIPNSENWALTILGYNKNFNKIPKIKIVHMLVDPTEERQATSIKYMEKLVEYSGFEYVQMINERYTDLPPTDNCSRPHAVDMLPGEYKLSPAHYGNYLAHKSAISTHLNNEHDAILFCECDAIFIKPIEEVYNTIIKQFNNINQYDLNYISFGKRIPNWHYEEYDDFGITDRMSEAHCYLISSNSELYYHEKFNNSKWDTYDMWLNSFIFPERKSGIVKEPISIQCSGKSYLDQIHKDGTTLLHEGSITYSI